MIQNPGKTVDEITQLHRTTVDRWHQQELDNPHEGLLQVVCRQHQFNFLLWHEEDIARSPDVNDARIAAVKRAIDGYNQQRNDWIEKIDDFLLQQLAGGDEGSNRVAIYGGRRRVRSVLGLGAVRRPRDSEAGGDRGA